MSLLFSYVSEHGNRRREADDDIRELDKLARGGGGKVGTVHLPRARNLQTYLNRALLD